MKKRKERKGFWWRLLIVLCSMVICIFPAPIGLGFVALGSLIPGPLSGVLILAIGAVVLPLTVRIMMGTSDLALNFLENHCP